MRARAHEGRIREKRSTKLAEHEDRKREMQRVEAAACEGICKVKPLNKDVRGGM